MTQPVPAAVPPRKRTRRGLEVALALLLALPAAFEVVRHRHGGSGLARIADTEVGIVFHAWSGDLVVADTPGLRPFAPWFQEVHVVDKSPNAFTFQGNQRVSVNHVPRLLVRARDGSSFWFDEVVLQYALEVGRAAHVLEDSGAGDAFKEELLRCHARAILRDEFGRYAAGEAVRPEAVAAATRRSLERMNAALAPHGIAVLEISSPKPAFDKQYEDLINRRKLADQEAEKLRGIVANADANASERERRVRTDKERELLKLEGNLARDLGAAGKERIRALAEADNAYAEKVAQGRVARAEQELSAAVLSEKVRGRMEDARARAELLRRHGAGAVRAAFVDALAGIRFEIAPYGRDPDEPRTPRAPLAREN